MIVFSSLHTDEHAQQVMAEVNDAADTLAQAATANYLADLDLAHVERGEPT